jgi:hypothetical protein
MPDLRFEEPGVGSITARRPKPKRLSFSDRLIALGLAKDEAQANLYLIGFIIVGFGLIIYLNVSTFSTPTLAPDDSITNPANRL